MPSAVFRRLDFTEALELSTVEGKLLVVVATARDSLPCQVMDRDVWTDSDVRAWLVHDALAIQVEVEHEPEVKQRLGIREVPTVVAFLNGSEIARIAGGQTAEQLVAWLRPFSLDVLRARAATNPTDMGLRRQLGQWLAHAGHLEAAMIELLWLWEHMLEYDPKATAVRLSYVVANLEWLVARHPPARVAVTELRDRVTPPLDREPERRAFLDWIGLNKALGDSAAVLGWFDSVYKTFASGSRWHRVVEVMITPLLMADHRWADARRSARHVPQPASTARVRRRDARRHRARRGDRDRSA